MPLGDLAGIYFYFRCLPRILWYNHIIIKKWGIINLFFYIYTKIKIRGILPSILEEFIYYFYILIYLNVFFVGGFLRFWLYLSLFLAAFESSLKCLIISLAYLSSFTWHKSY